MADEEEWEADIMDQLEEQQLEAQQLYQQQLQEYNIRLEEWKTQRTQKVRTANVSRNIALLYFIRCLTDTKT